VIGLLVRRPVLMCVFVRVPAGFCVRVGMRAVFVRIGMGVRMCLVRVFAVRVRSVRRLIVRVAVRFVAGRNHIDFGPGQPAAHHLALVQVSPHAELGAGFLKHGEGNAPIDKSTQQHVAADAGKTFKISNTHRLRF